MEVVNDGEPLASDFVLEQSRSLGLSIVRTLVGDLGGIFSLTSADADKGVIARVEVPLGDLIAAAERADEIVSALDSLGYRYVTLDLAGLRSGNLNAALSSALA